MSRPTGITIVAIYLMVTGVFIVLLGLEAAGITHFGLAPLAPGASLWASSIIIAGVLSLVVAFGIFSLARWAWYLAVAVLIFRAVADGFGLVSWALSSVPGGVSIVDFAITILLLWYFTRPNVRAAFGTTKAT
jgi:hypothetical protein